MKDKEILEGIEYRLIALTKAMNALGDDGDNPIVLDYEARMDELLTLKNWIGEDEK